jgi:hypothetical protein
MVEKHILVWVCKPHIKSQINLLQHDRVWNLVNMTYSFLQTLTKLFMFSERKFRNNRLSHDVFWLNDISRVKINSNDISF